MVKDFIAILAGYMILVTQSIAGDIISKSYYSPNLILPFILYLAAIDFGSARGASISFVLGYLCDIFSGAPSGVHMFVIPATYLIFRTVYAKVMLKGVVFQIIITFLACLTSSLLIIGIRTVFERSIFALKVIFLTVTVNSVITAVVSPVVFRLGKVILPESPKRREEKLLIR